MKKIVPLLMAALMTLSIAACAPKTVEKPVEAQAEVETEVTVEAEKPLTFGMVCLHDEQSTYDKNFIDAFNAACEAKGVNGLIKTGVSESNECYEACADLVDRGASIVFADSFGHENFMLQAAKEFPEVQFCHATGTNAHTTDIANFHNAFASIYEGRYLAGVAAGLKLKEMMEADSSIEPKVGYIGAFTYAEVISGYTAWYLGVRSIVPEVTMEVQFTGSWYDEALEKEAAQTLINNGAVLISQHADSMGAPTACEEAGVPNVSYNGSTIGACPKTFIVSSRINWQPYFEYIIDCVREGKEIEKDWVGTIETGSVQLTPINEAVAAKGTQEYIDKLLADGFKVFDTNTFTVNGEKLEEYMADVDTDAKYEKDTQVIEDGEFKESKYRSAPYFDIMIDGITTLNAMY